MYLHEDYREERKKQLEICDCHVKCKASRMIDQVPLFNGHRG
jgi:hypothetical protein